MKIIVCGAGIGGLYAAHLFGKKGHSVTVYERANGVDEMRYDWHDDVNPYELEKLGLKVPKESFPKKDWTFISPSGFVQGMEQSEENRDYSIERRPLNRYLYGLASEYCDIIFGKEVSGAFIDDGKVSGVVFGDGTVEKCDLLIDSCGVNSVIRKSLPETFGIDKEIDPNGVFIAYRAFYDAVPDVTPQYTNKVYMKHCGEQGISWCIRDNDKTQVNVLIGRVGKLDEENLERALQSLREDNPILGQNLRRGGMVCSIPVRRPLDIFIADGYAAVGDSACMTVPMIGSGIITSLNAAKLLFEAIGEENVASVDKLWKYQVAVYKNFGAVHCGVDHMKNWLLVAKNSVIDMIFAKKVLSNEDLQKVSIGKLVTLTAKDGLKKVGTVGLFRLHRLIPMAFMIARTQKIVNIALQIPETYAEDKVAVWANRLDKVCNR